MLRETPTPVVGNEYDLYRQRGLVLCHLEFGWRQLDPGYFKVCRRPKPLAYGPYFWEGLLRQMDRFR